MSSTRESLPIVETRSVTRHFGSDEVVTALDEVSILVEPGEFVAVQGPSGCGKSTLLHVLGALDTPSSGTVHFAGVDLAKLNDNERSNLRRRSIGMVLSLVELVPAMTAWENVAIALLLDGRPIKEGQDRATELLESVDLGQRTKALAGQLSAGEAQRVALARALYNEPQLLIADEPTSLLDSVRSDEVLNILRGLADDGRTIVMATHDSRAAAHADRSVRLLDGRVVGCGSTAQEPLRDSWSI